MVDLRQSNPHSRIDVLSRACASTAAILGNVSREQLSLATPCRDWEVRELINHIAGAADYFVDVAECGGSPEDRDWPDYAEGDFVTSFGEFAGRLVTAFSAPGAMERVMVLLNGPSPGAVCIQVATGEIFVHGWDLARATGQATPTDQGVAAALLASVWPSMCADVRNEHPSVFGPEIHVPPGRPAIDRLVGFIGRDPDWVSGR